MRLYHGSYTDIQKVDLKRSLKGKDFGQGFYLSADYAQALEMAKLRSLATRTEPVVNEFDFDETGLEGLKVLRFDGYTVDWAEFILANRRNYADTNIHDYDVVIGPIADDRIGRQIRLLLDEEIDMNEFLERLKFMKGVTFQYFFGSERSLKFLHRV